MLALERVAGLSVVEMRTIEAHKIVIASVVFGMTAGTTLIPIAASVESSTRIDARLESLMAFEAARVGRSLVDPQLVATGAETGSVEILVRAAQRPR
jgi:hypothetical protein